MRFAIRLAACWSLLFSAALLAADARPAFTLEELFRPPALNAPIISPDGKTMAVTVPFKGRMNLALLELESQKLSALTGFTDFDVINVHWVGNGRLVFSLGQFNSPTGPDQFDGGGLFVVGRDGKDFRRLSPTLREVRASNSFVFRSLSFFRSIPDSDDEIIASGNLTSLNSIDLYRLNLKTGRHTLLTQGRPAELSRGWLMDSKLVPRLMVAGLPDKPGTQVYYRKSEQAEWQLINRDDIDKRKTLIPLAFDSDDQTLQVAYNGGRDTMAIFRFDPNTGKLGDMIASHPRYDMGAAAGGETVGGLTIDPRGGKILGYSVNAEKPETVWVDEKSAVLQASLDRALPNRVNRFSYTGDGKRLIITSFSDTLPPRWYLYDEAARTLKEIGAARPWLDGKLVEQRPFLFKTRDGLEIPGYYFLPRDYKPGAKLPTIVHIHGGPFARPDTWGSGFGVREGQLFASRGYAVIVPNFRITPGLGSKIYYKGFGAYGRQMSDDHEDALKWGIEQGFVDPKRVCISGASYGGYAALQALIRSQELWNCAIAGLAPTDMKFQLTTQQGDTANNAVGVAFWKSVMGVRDLETPIVREISPLFNAEKIKQPVFLYAGASDIRVPLPQIENMADALTKAGNAPKAFVVKKNEGHGYGVVENNVDLYEKILAFLKERFGE